MDSTALTFLLVNGAAVLLLPRRWAALPLLVGACYMTRGAGIQIGPFSFTIVKLLAVVGITRTLMRRDWPAGGLNRLDWALLAWGIWIVASVSFHSDPSGQLPNRLGIVFDGWGFYFIFRGLCRSREDIAQLFRVAAIALGPIAVAMLVEKTTAHNMFAVFRGVPETPEIRQGSVRAQGPFAHSILAGTIGGVCLPMMLGLWTVHRRAAVLGIAACATMVYASASSGPVMSAAIGVAAVMFWRYRDHMRKARWAAVAAYLLLAAVMNSPPYYLIARIDLAGGSTGWHRARLIESAFEHLGEWWLAGTDYTRHWMPTGVSWSAEHTDITNHYLSMGVFGGLPLMLLFIAILALGFSQIGKGLNSRPVDQPAWKFLIWSAGAALASHAATCTSIAYFDQSIVFLYFTLAVTSAAALEVTTADVKPVSVSTRAPRWIRPAPRGGAPAARKPMTWLPPTRPR